MHFRQKQTFIASGLLIGIMLSPDMQASSYTATQLDGVLGGFFISSATGINDSGQVVGIIPFPSNSNIEYQAALWQAGSTIPINLGVSGGTSYASAINDKGQVVGYAETSINTPYHAALWQAGSTSPTFLGEGDYTEATGINTSGQVVGFNPTTGGAALWQVGSTNTISLSTQSSYASGINDIGQVVGNVLFITGGTEAWQAALWQAGSTTAINLGAVSGYSSIANAINNNGQVVGGISSFNGSTNGQFHAALWQAGSSTPIDLGTLGGNTSQAYGINNSGQVVGYAATTSFIGASTLPLAHATLWQSGFKTAIDLNSLVSLSDGAYLSVAKGINASGQIIADGSDGYAYILTPNITPVPAPSAIWLFGSALAVFIGNRHRIFINQVA